MGLGFGIAGAVAALFGFLVLDSSDGPPSGEAVVWALGLMLLAGALIITALIIGVPD